jgi:hypothetical protein
MNELVSRWFENDCPKELVAKVLAFAGPREVSALSEVTTAAWSDLMRSEALWRVLSQNPNHDVTTTEETC